MRLQTFTCGAGTLVLIAASVVSAKHGVHEHLQVLHERHRSQRNGAHSAAEIRELGVEVRSMTSEELENGPVLEKRSTCSFPSGLGLVPVTTSDENAGWAMSPNQPCLPGNYCPYACPSGEVSMQWDPEATSYTYPLSMYGGLYCDENGNIQKPIPDNPYCQQTSASIGVLNNAGSVVSFCQTVLPGNEAMLIPTSVESWAQLAVPDTSYWCGTAAHYYINAPGVTTDVACVWGNSNSPVGNWSPYVAGANTAANGETFIKLGWNPIYLEAATPFRNTVPTWGVEIVCDGGGCNGLPCAIDPSVNGVNEMVGDYTDGAGGAAFCVVTVPQGVSANFVITDSSGSVSSQSSSSTTTTSTSTTTTTTTTSTTSTTTSTTSSTTSTIAWSTTWGHPGQFYGATTSSHLGHSRHPTSLSTRSTSWGLGSSSILTATSNSSLWPSGYKPTHSPYYSLFNHTQTALPTDSMPPSSASAVVTGPTKIPSSPAQTGSATTLRLSFVSSWAGAVATLFVLCI